MAQITSLQIEQLTVTGFSCFADERRWTFGRMTTVTGHNYQGKCCPEHQQVRIL